MNNSSDKSTGNIPGNARKVSWSGLLLPTALILISVAILFSDGFLTVLARQTGPGIKVGERLTYTISFNNLDSAGYAEIRVVSKGKLSGKDVIELYGKLKSGNLLSAAFYLWDEERTTYVSPDTGYPLYIRSVSNTGILPKPTVSDFLNQPSGDLDLLSMLYKARQMGGSGNFSVLESGRVYTFDLTPTGGSQVTTEAGTFDTDLSTVQSEYLSEKGIRDFQIAFSSDERALPVKASFRTDKGLFEVRLASVQDLSPRPTPTPSAQTPTPTPVATPNPTPRPYVDNTPLSPDLPFALGETLRYRVKKGDDTVGEVSMKAAERKLFQGKDALLLSANVLQLGPANDILGRSDLIRSWVDPVTLAPLEYTMRFESALSQYSQNAVFDQTAGTVKFGDGGDVAVPVGTHDIISLAYAVRAFNLRPNPDPNNPVNDTRVAVLLGRSPIVITMRPSAVEPLEIGGVKERAQMISVRVGTPDIDKLNIRFWLTADGRRIPLKLSAGQYTAELISVTSEPPAGDKTARPRVSPENN